MADLEWLGDEALAALKTGVAEGLQEACDIVLTESNLDSPTLAGDLDASATIEVDGNEAGIGYESEYARKQHENTWYQHPQGDKPKFLENALTSRADAALEALGSRIQSALDG